MHTHRPGLDDPRGWFCFCLCNGCCAVSEIGWFTARDGLHLRPARGSADYSYVRPVVMSAIRRPVRESLDGLKVPSVVGMTGKSPTQSMQGHVRVETGAP